MNENTRRRHLRKGFGIAALLVTAVLAGCATSGERGAPTIAHAGVLESVLEPVLAGQDFQPLFDRLADGVVLEVTISGNARPSRALRGKRDVMGFFLNENAAYGFGLGLPLEYSGSGDRVVVRGVQTGGSGRSGVTVGGREAAVVVDFERGRIVRFLVVQDAVPALSAARAYGR